MLWKRIVSVFRVLTGRRDFESGMMEELRFHLEARAADLARSGLSPGEAARRARIEFGSPASVQEECREARGLQLVEAVWRQGRYAARTLRKSPAFTATVLLTLAVTMGANLTIFAVIDAVLLRPLPFPEADRLVTMYNTYPKAGVERDGSSLTNYYERRGRIPALEAMALYRPGAAIAGEPGATVREPIMRVTADFFRTLGTGPAVGRVFSEGETTYQTDGVAMVTDRYWKERMNGGEIAGRRIRLDGVEKKVIGVLPAGFRFLSSEARIYVPLASSPAERTPEQRHSGGNTTQLIARLRPGASIAEAQAQIDAQNNALEANGPQGKAMAEAGFRSLVKPLHGDHVAAVRPTLLVLQGGVLVLLLTGLVNLVNLLLVRASGRVKEVAVRRALGASRAHILAEGLVETAVLAVLGGLLGFGAALAGTRGLAIFGVDRLPLGAQIELNGRIALAALAAAMATGIVLAAPIAWFNLRGHLSAALGSETRGGTAAGSVHRLRHGFLVAQFAMATMLLSGAGLLALSLKQAMAIEPGFAAGNVLTGQISIPWSGYQTSESRVAFAERVMQEAGRLPGVQATGMATNLPFSGVSGKSAATVKGYVAKRGESPHAIYSYGVAGDYFQAMGFTLRAGRFLTEADSRRGVRVCVVDDVFARAQWPGQSALGRQLWLGYREQPEQADDSELFTVAGVVGRVKQAGLTEDPAPGAVYYPYAYFANASLFVAARTTVEPESFGLELQKAVRRADPDIPVTEIRSMPARISESLETRRTPALLAGIFAAMALLLAAIGTYGVVSYAVSQRRREIGVRMALGATPGQIRRQFLGVALRLLIPGTAFGLAAAALAGRAMQAVLFEVGGANVAVMGAAAGAMAMVSLAATLAPSRRAAWMSPLKALSGD